MNVESQLKTPLTHIRNLVKHVNKRNFNETCEHIKQFVKEHGLEADRSSLRHLFSVINFSDASPTVTVQLQAKLLGSQLQRQLQSSSFVSNICFAFDQYFVTNQKSLKPAAVADLVSHVSRLTGINKLCECIFALAVTHSSHPELRKSAKNNLEVSLPELINSYLGNNNSSAATSGLQEISFDLLQYLLCCLSDYVKPELEHQFLVKLREEFPRQAVPLVLAPFLYGSTTATAAVAGAGASETDAEAETTASNSNSSSSEADAPNEVGIEDIYDHLSEIIFTNQGKNNIMDTSWINLIHEIGYEFTSSVEECKNHLCSRERERAEVQAKDVAKIVGLMCRRHSSLLDCNVNLPTPANFWPGQAQGQSQGQGAGSSSSGSSQTQSTSQQQGSGNSNNNDGAEGNSSSDKKDKKETTEATQTWKPDVFVQALKEVVPQLNWKDVCLELDHPEFVLKDRIGLDLLLTILRLATSSSLFPHPECIYRHWANTEGQLSLITTMLKNPDLFSFSDFVFSQPALDVLKTAPDAENKEISAWKSLHLVEVLLSIADKGYYTQVHEIFKFPAQNCPDVLFLALLHINPPLSPLRLDLFNQLIPTFLGNHPNSNVILASAWSSTNFQLRPNIMNAMSEWYLRGNDFDQGKLSRILDLAQDLKALSSLLNARSFLFIIDLACLASRREYLKLEKWLTDKIRDHGEPFMQAMIKVLLRRCPQLVNAKVSEDQLPPKQAQLLPETVTTMINCLQNCINNCMQPEMVEVVMQMTANVAIMANKARAQQQPGLVPPPPPNMLRGHRGMDLSGGIVPPPPQQPFSGNLNAQMFAPGMDPLTNMSNNLAGLNLSGPNGGFNFGNMLTSPSRLMNPGASPYPLNPMQMPQAPPPPNVGNLGRMLPGGPQQPTPTPTPTAPNPNNPVMADLQIPVSKEVEDEVNSYFQRIYNHQPNPTLSIDEVLDILQRFKESSNRREQEVFLCMLRNLFEEYRFFCQYPEKELQITAQLFGGIIDRNLVPTFVALGLSLRCVLDALRKPEGNKLFYFGITALDRFRTRLHTYNKYCEHIRSIPHFSDFPPHLIQYVEYGMHGQEPPAQKLIGLSNTIPSAISSGPPTEPLFRANSMPGNVPGVTLGSGAKTSVAVSHATRMKSIANATNIDTLLVANQEEKVTVPPEPVQDKTAFIFNNLSQLNIPQKCEEIKEIMTKEYWPWLAQYLVLKRASMEFNFHTLYYNFLDALKNGEINRFVTKETLRNIKVLLRSDKGVINFSDRSLLKNLGHWLGMMTLGRNRPILQLDLDLKSLLAEAYHKGQQELLFVVPFVAKILESSAKSRIFRSPNPWTMGIMYVLGELHQEPELKLNLKFEIEVLCKTLNLELAKLRPVIYLKDPTRALLIEQQMSQPKPKQPEPIAAAPALPSQQPSPAQAPQQPPQPQQQQQAPPPPPPADVDAQAAAAMMMGSGGSGANSTPGSVASPNLPTDPSQVVLPPPEPRYSYVDVNVSNFQLIAQHLILPPNIPFLHTNPGIKLIVINAVERTITDWLQPVVDRSIRIACATTEQIIRKDFALDADENRMRTAAHQMVRNLAAGMAMITGKDEIARAISQNVHKAFVSSMTGMPSLTEVQAAAMQLANENVELVCAFIQKTSAEKAAAEIDRRLSTDFETRKIAREEGNRFVDAQILSYQQERLPEAVRIKVGPAPATLYAVYSEFARSIPGFQQMSDRDIALFVPKPQDLPPPNVFANDESSMVYAEVASKMEAFMNTAIGVPSLQVQASKMHMLLNALMSTRRQRDQESAFNLLTRAVEGLTEGLVNVPDHIEQMKLYQNIHLRILSLLQNSFGAPNTERAVTKCFFDIREEVRYNVEAARSLITSHFVNLNQFDGMLRDCMDNGNNYVAISFGIALLERLIMEDRAINIVQDNEFMATVELLGRLTQHRHRYPECIVNAIDTLWSGNFNSSSDFSPFNASERYLAGASHYIHSGMHHVRSCDTDDPPGLQEKTEFLLKDWVALYTQQNQQSTRDARNFGAFVQKMNTYGILKTDDLITRFFRQATHICTDVVYRMFAEPNLQLNQAKNKIFQWIDAFVHLIAMLVRHSGEAGNPTTKINLLNKVLGIVLGTLLKDQEMRGTNFQQVGYHRFFMMLFMELCSADMILESLMHSIVSAFAYTYHLLNPSVAPGFCFAWLELISHRVFLGRILVQIPGQKGWPLYAQLLQDLFKYLAPFLRNTELGKPVQLLYKGTLRVLLVLLHDFPEFLCDYHFGFCDTIPPNCVQMRNIILSAFPRNMRLPDPFTPNLKVDMLSDSSNAPKVSSSYIMNIQPPNFKKDLDSYLKARAPVTFLSELRGHLQVTSEPGTRYNMTLMNALVMYVGTQAIALIRNKNFVPNTSNIAHSAHMDIFQNLAVDLDTEGRYLFLNAIANQLRYPNSHTHYFSCAVLHLFAEANSEAIQEQITRVLLERLIVNRPHPWGLLITFIELIKNPIYKFWDHDFVHCAPEITKLFESVARSCLAKSNPPQQLNMPAVDGEGQEVANIN
ncbi:CCR4-NOT transcription complex subunit 1 isoform X1 [Drosophila bipectinata]|uniref:CCR4-NOT transcription complex subunit 1 isoform X1 n=1 Tax=Drosophila bipectinata TaxID=42026 RepID=UPI001C891DC8|nr:CCR4-NOT transcription complex subunit 1 isoform X1 [Drosophila bipectinata]